MQPLFDHELLRNRLRRRDLNDARSPFLNGINDELTLRLSPVKRDFPLALNLFPPSSKIEASLAALTKIGALHTLHAADMEDFETLPLQEGSFDLIVTCLGLQYANDLPGILVQLQRALKDGGLLLGCIIGGDSLSELREAFAEAETDITGGVTPRIHPSIDIRQMGALMQRAKFVEPIMDVEKFELVYANALSFLKDLRAWSPGNLLFERSCKFLPRTLLARMDEIYREKFSAPGGKVTAKFDLIWFSGWAA